MDSGHGPRGSEDVVAASTERTVLVRTRLLTQGGRPGLARPPWSLPFAHGGRLLDLLGNGEAHGDACRACIFAGAAKASC